MTRAVVHGDRLPLSGSFEVDRLCVSKVLGFAGLLAHYGPLLPDTGKPQRLSHRRRWYCVGRHRLAASTGSFKKLESKDGSVVVRNLSLTWPNGRPALRDLNFKVDEGQFCMVVGPNGCGKSTLLRVLHGLIFADRGLVQVPEPLGFVFQDPNLQMLYPTVYMEIMSGTDESLPILERAKMVQEAVKKVGIESFLKQQTDRLSGGQKQKVATATMLVRRPKFMLFDEITASLDPEARVSVLQFAKTVAEDLKAGSIWVTHVYEELQYADRVIVLDNGRIIADGTYEKVLPQFENLWSQHRDEW